MTCKLCKKKGHILSNCPQANVGNAKEQDTSNGPALKDRDPTFKQPKWEEKNQRIFQRDDLKVDGDRLWTIGEHSDD